MSKSEFSKLIMLTDNFENSLVYRCACSCGDKGHDVYVEVEYDKELNMMFLNFYKDVGFFNKYRREILWFDNLLEKFRNRNSKLRECYSYLYENTVKYFFQNFGYRLRKSFRLLFVGYLEMNEDFVFQDSEHVDNFIKAIEEGRQLLTERQEQKKELSNRVKTDSENLLSCIEECIKTDPDNRISTLERKCLPLIKRINKDLLFKIVRNR